MGRCPVHGSISILSFFLSPFFFFLSFVPASLSVSSFHKSSATRPSENCSEVDPATALPHERRLKRSELPIVQFPAAGHARLASLAGTSFVSLVEAPEVLGYRCHRHLDGQFRTGTLSSSLFGFQFCFCVCFWNSNRLGNSIYQKYIYIYILIASYGEQNYWFSHMFVGCLCLICLMGTSSSVYFD